MVCMRVAFHENDGNHETTQTTKTTQTATNKELSAGLAEITGITENHRNNENHGNPGCKSRAPQATGLEIPEKRGDLQYRKRQSPLQEERGKATRNGNHDLLHV